MALVYGQSGGISVAMDGPFAGGGGTGKMTEIVLPVSGWQRQNSSNPWQQDDVSVNGISGNSIIELIPSTDIINKLHHTAITAVNDEGVVTVYAYGDKPTEDLTVYAVLTEVTVVETVR